GTTMSGDLDMASNNILNVGYLEADGNAAASGFIRLQNNQWIAARNALNSADIDMIKVNAADLVEFGASLASFTLGGAVTGNNQNITGLGDLDVNGNVSIADTNIAFDGASTTFTTTGAFTLTPGGAVTLGDNGDTMYINSSDWDISTAGVMTNIDSIANKAGTALTIYGGDDGGDANEDVIITADNWTVDAPGNLQVDGTLQVDGATLSAISATTINLATANVGSTIQIGTQNTTADTITIGNNNASTLMTLTGGDDWSITSVGAGTFASLDVSDGNITDVGDIALDTISADDGSSFSISNDWTNAGNTIADLGTVTTADINGGTIDGVSIGATTKVLSIQVDESGLVVDPTGDANADLITVGVTGAPKISWNEAADEFDINKGINVTGDVGATTGTFATKVMSPELENTGDITIDAINAAADSTVYILNSDAVKEADLNVEGDLIVGGTTMSGDLDMASNNILNVGYLEADGNAAASGFIRLQNNQWIAARNALNSADIDMIKVNAADLVEFGASLA
ncbi:unnamed protein product, partial [marine sediment metagenome]